MLSYTYVPGFGLAPEDESLVDLVRRVIRHSPAASYGLSAAFTNFDAFLTGGESATYKDSLVSCAKEKKRPVCALLAYPPGTKAMQGPVADMQKATDALLLKIPAYNLEGVNLKLTVPDGNGGTTETTKPLPTIPKDAAGRGPIYIAGGGYDGVVGPGTSFYVGIAAILAGALKAPPNDAVSSLATPYRTDWMTAQAAGIAAYFRDVTANFDSLLQGYIARDMKPAATPLAPETITQIVVLPTPKRKFPTAMVVGLGAAAAAVVGVGVYALAGQPPGTPGARPIGPSPLTPTEAMMGRRRRHAPRHTWIHQWRAR